MPHQSWEVADDKKLRNVISNVNSFETEDYYEWFTSPSMMATDGVVAPFGSSSQDTVTFLQAQDRYCKVNFRGRTNWVKGQIEVTSYFRADSGDTFVVRLSHRVGGQSVGNASPLPLLDHDESVALPAVNGELFSLTCVGTMNSPRYDLLSLEVEREGTHGDDTYNAALAYVGSWIRWKRATGS